MGQNISQTNKNILIERFNIINNIDNIYSIEMEKFSNEKESNFQYVLREKYLRDIDMLIYCVENYKKITKSHYKSICDRYNIRFYNKIHSNISCYFIPKNCLLPPKNYANDIMLNIIIKIYNYRDSFEKIILDNNNFILCEQSIENIKNEMINVSDIKMIYVSRKLYILLIVLGDITFLMFNKYCVVIKDDFVIRNFIDNDKSTVQKINKYASFEWSEYK